MLSPGPVIGPGGYLGALGKAVALMHFATIGGMILAGSVTIGGLLLCTDYAFIDASLFLYGLASLPKVRRVEMQAGEVVAGRQTQPHGSGRLAAR